MVYGLQSFEEKSKTYHHQEGQRQHFQRRMLVYKGGDLTAKQEHNNHCYTYSYYHYFHMLRKAHCGYHAIKREYQVYQHYLDNCISQRSNGQIPIIAVGGIFTAEDAIEKLQAGAALVQVYTGFVYEGPAIASNICKGILKSI